MIIKGKKVALRSIGPAEVDEFYKLVSAVEEYGEHYPISFKAELLFIKEY